MSLPQAAAAAAFCLTDSFAQFGQKKIHSGNPVVNSANQSMWSCCGSVFPRDVNQRCSLCVFAAQLSSRIVVLRASDEQRGGRLLSRPRVFQPLWLVQSALNVDHCAGNLYENYEQNFKQWIPKVSGSKIEMTILMARQAFGAGEPDC